jgi:hypothetical protein
MIKPLLVIENYNEIRLIRIFPVFAGRGPIQLTTKPAVKRPVLILLILQ